MKDGILIVLLLIAACLALTTGFTRQAVNTRSDTPRINIKGIPDQGLSVIGPSDPSFDQLVTTQLKGKQNPAVEALRPFSVCIKNTNQRSVVAFTLKWDLMRTDGSVRVKTIDYIELWHLMGVKQSEADGYVIRPGSVWFAAPSVEIAGNIFAQDRNGATALTAEDTATIERVSAELLQYTNITVTLDGAFFDDGQFVGPDNTGFFNKVVAERDAKRDLIRQIKQDLQQDPSKQRALSHIEEIANGQEVEDNTGTAQTNYTKHKKDAATDILRMRKSIGGDRAIEILLQQMHEPVPELRKL